jgi:hypothetical protein
MKSHLNTPKEKLYCFVKSCERFYFSLETLKKHLQKSHKKEYDLLKEKYLSKNFNQIYNIIKNQNELDENFDFINFKDNLDFDTNEDIRNIEDSSEKNKRNKSLNKKDKLNDKKEGFTNSESESEQDINKIPINKDVRPDINNNFDYCRNVEVEKKAQNFFIENKKIKNCNNGKRHFL